MILSFSVLIALIQINRYLIELSEEKINWKLKYLRSHSFSKKNGHGTFEI